MRVIVAGSREGATQQQVDDILDVSPWEITELVSGTARGVDRMGESWAARHDVPIERYPADWERFGRAAGLYRNERMAEHADALIAFWDGESPGTEHMIRMAAKHGIPYAIIRIL